MTVLSDYVARMVAAGMSQEEAMQIVAEVFAAGAANVAAKSSNAARQQRYRERKKAQETVTNRNASVTQAAPADEAESVTNRNETVTPLRSGQNDIYLSSTTINSKEEKKDTAKRKRNAPLRDDWAPSQTSFRIAEQCGQDVRLVEQIFRDYLKSSGKLYADYDAAFNNFIRNQQRFNGAKNGKQPSQIIQAADNLRAKLASFDGRTGGQDGLRSGEGAPAPRLLSHG